MTMLEAYEGIREALVSIIADTWSVDVVTAQSGQERTGEFAVLMLENDIENLNGANPVSDEWVFSFLIVGRFTLANGADAELEAITKLSELNDALTAVKNPGNGYMPLLQSASTRASDPSDEMYDVSLSYSVRAAITRGV